MSTSARGIQATQVHVSGEIPEGWNFRQLKACLASLQSGKLAERGWSPQCLARPAVDAWGVLKTTSVQMGEYRPEFNKELPESLNPKEWLEVRPGDFLVTTTGPRARCGVVCFVRTTPSRLILSGKMLRFRVDDRYLLSPYLMYLLMSQKYQKVLDQFKVGTSDSSVSIGNQQILDLEIPVAPVEEQSMIVDVLEGQFALLDAVLESVRRSRVEAVRLRRALLRDAFSGVLTNPDLGPGELPVGWTPRPLRDIVSLSSESGVPSENSNLPVVGMEHVEPETGRVLGTGMSSDYRSSSFVVRPGQVLYGRLRPYLNKVFMPHEHCYASREFIPLNSSEVLLSDFLAYRLRAQDFVQFAVSLNAGDRPRVKWPQIADYVIHLPPLHEQHEIVDLLERELGLLDLAMKAADRIEMEAKSFRRSLLHSAFNGELTREWRESHG